MKSKIVTIIWVPLMVVVTVLSGCSSIPTRSERLQSAREMAPTGYRDNIIRTRNFDLLSIVPAEPSHFETIIIFIEGDGFAWFNKAKPSQDPTPIRQTVLSLLRASPHPNTLYLARPCQFVGPTNGQCTPSLWMAARYSEDVVAAMNEAVDLIKQDFGASKLVLVGHSGGGTIATLLAARRSDIAAIITMAALLDLDAFTSHHNVTSMSASLNPINVVAELTDTPQLHLFGHEDKRVPRHLADRFLEALPRADCIQTRTIAATHEAGWTNLRPDPLDTIPTCKASRL